MEKIIINKYNLKDSDMTEVVKRVKILLINSKNEILLGYSHHNYQFIGGHVEEGEELVQTINREVEEETGIKLNLKDAKAFSINYGYYKDWPEEGKNRKIEIYYYEIRTDLKPELKNTNYTEHEQEGKFNLQYIPLEEVESVILKNSTEYGDEHGIANEMIELFKIFKKHE